MFSMKNIGLRLHKHVLNCLKSYTVL